jgi:hypothetical protein
LSVFSFALSKPPVSGKHTRGESAENWGKQ